MPRYKHIDTTPRFLAVDLERQLLPGSFANAVHYLREDDFDLSRSDTRYRNDEVGAPAYPPAMLLSERVTWFALALSPSLSPARGREECPALAHAPCRNN